MLDSHLLEKIRHISRTRILEPTIGMSFFPRSIECMHLVIWKTNRRYVAILDPVPGTCYGIIVPTLVNCQHFTSSLFSVPFLLFSSTYSTWWRNRALLRCYWLRHFLEFLHIRHFSSGLKSIPILLSSRFHFSVPHPLSDMSWRIILFNTLPPPNQRHTFLLVLSFCHYGWACSCTELSSIRLQSFPVNFPPKYPSYGYSVRQQRPIWNGIRWIMLGVNNNAGTLDEATAKLYAER